ncbi:uncharacterized protein LOC115266360 [Aedes albopictus]|uniref:Peptidase A2 domain-containing protein n=1 Tax=Aedes albopictus TaxID=7160 RepID=A0ABM2A2C4_AEDAL
MSNSGLIGSIDHYQPGRSFTNYVERFEILCRINKVKDEEKSSWFMSLGGDELFDEIKLLFPKQDVSTLSYEDIVKKLKARFDKTEPALMYRYKFANRFQGLNESTENFVLAINLLAENCNFKEFKNEAIRDRLIFGLKDKDLQKKLLSEDDIELKEVEKLIISSELAGQRFKEVESTNPGAGVMSVKYRLGRKKGDDYNQQQAGYSGRYRSRSRSFDRGQGRNNGFTRQNSSRERDNSRDRYDRNTHSNAVCNYCKRRGHIRRNCYILQNRSAVKFVDEVQVVESQQVSKFDRLKLRDSSAESDISCMQISCVNSITEPCLVEVVIENIKLTMEIDTGSAVAVLSENLYRKYFKHIPILTCTKKLVVVDGAKLSVVGQISVRVCINDLEIKSTMIVLKSERDFIPLLGRDWMEAFYPNWKKLFINNIEQTTKEQQALDPIVGYEAELTVKPDQPIFKRAYQVPYKIKDKFLEHLDMLEEQGVITPVKASEWASPVIAVLKKDNEIRMIALGTHVLTAHRSQLKKMYHPNRRSKVIMPVRNNQKRRRVSIEEEQDFPGFPEAQLQSEERQAKHRKVMIRSPIETRSKKRLGACRTESE